MRTCHALGCLSVTLFWQSAVCIGNLGRGFVDNIDASSAHQVPQADGQHRWRRDHLSSSAFSRPPQTEDLPSTDDSSQLTSTDDSKTRIDDLASDLIITLTASGSEPAPTLNMPLTSPGRTATTTTASVARTTVIATTHVTPTPSSNVEPVTTTSAIPSSDSEPFHMSAASIAATVVLCCFVLVGVAIMLYYRLRRYQAQRKSHGWSSLAPDSDHDGGTKSLGSSRVSSGMSGRESIMFHPERSKSDSTTFVYSKQAVQTVTEQAPPYDYGVEHTDIPMGDIELNDDADRSPVSPLLVSTFPRPITSTSQNRDSRQSLRREFSFESKPTAPISAPQQSRLNRRSALSSNPPSDWPLAMPSHYGRGFYGQPSPDYQAVAPIAHRSSSGGWHVVAPNHGFEDMQSRGGYAQPGQ